MGMTDRQFDSYQARLIDIIEEILEEKDDKKKIEKLKKLKQKLESEQKRP